MQNSVKILEIFPSMLGSQTESTDIKQIASRALDKPGVFKLTWRLSTNLPNWGSPSLLVDLDSWTLTTTKKTSTVRSRLRCCFDTARLSLFSKITMQLSYTECALQTFFCCWCCYIKKINTVTMFLFWNNAPPQLRTWITFLRILSSFLMLNEINCDYKIL